MPVEAKVRIVAENATATAFASILTDANALSGKMREAFSAAFVGLSAAGLWEGIKGAIEYGDAIGKAAQPAAALDAELRRPGPGAQWRRQVPEHIAEHRQCCEQSEQKSAFQEGEQRGAG
jgi:hypothetical protein